MIVLAFIVCLHSAPDTCRERNLTFTGVTPMTCMVQAQAVLAGWEAGHPRWRVSRWRCVTGKAA